ncbi:MAG: TerC family protein [Rhodospirillaceae bacterium]|nr:TerC family protein [Rhodospirillaceae bacterium]
MDAVTDVSIWMWLGFSAIVLTILAFDLGVFHKEQRAIGEAEALKLSGLYVALAMIFAGWVFWQFGQQKGLEFLTGYVIEWSLSLDNIFVIALIFSAFAVPPQYQHRVLFWGILGALIMRLIMILAGTALIMEFRWIVYVFGAFLIVTGIKMLFASDEPQDVSKNWVVKWVRNHFPVTDAYHGEKFWVRQNGVWALTPLFLALIMVEVTDLVFAVDSIPAIFAITTDPFIVYTSNVFAILGLRALYFALAGVIRRFKYLKYGLALVLVVVGTKMTLVDIWKMPTLLALGITVSLIGGSILYSLYRTRGDALPAQPRAAE